MPRKKTIQPEPIDIEHHADGLEIHIYADDYCEPGQGQYKRVEWRRLKDRVLEVVAPMYVDQSGPLEPAEDVLATPTTFDKWYSGYDFPERDSSNVRRLLYKQVRADVYCLRNAKINAMENSAQSIARKIPKSDQFLQARSEAIDCSGSITQNPPKVSGDPYRNTHVYDSLE